jgi:protease I
VSRIAILAFRDFEDAEVATPRRLLARAGHEPVVVGRREGAALQGHRGRAEVIAELGLADARVEDFDALLLPGDATPERLRGNEDAVDFVRRFWSTGRPVAAIEEGIELLRVAGVLEGVRVTSPPAFRHHLQNAGALWVDEDLVADGPLITARNASQVEEFCAVLHESLPESLPGS